MLTEDTDKDIKKGEIPVTRGYNKHSDNQMIPLSYTKQKKNNNPNNQHSDSVRRVSEYSRKGAISCRKMSKTVLEKLTLSNYSFTSYINIFNTI